MYLLRISVSLLVLLLMSCGSGGALTPAESFNSIRSAVEKTDSEVIANYLTDSSLVKIGRHNQMLKDMSNQQLEIISVKYGYSVDKLRNLKISDSVSLYFFSEQTGIKLSRYFKENIVSTDIRGSRASVKTGSGIELEFLREGPYWKFDMSRL